jgi:hypothetical protein
LGRFEDVSIRVAFQDGEEGTEVVYGQVDMIHEYRSIRVKTRSQGIYRNADWGERVLDLRGPVVYDDDRLIGRIEDGFPSGRLKIGDAESAGGPLQRGMDVVGAPTLHRT